MRKMKKVIAMLIATTMVVAATTGCGSDASKAEGETHTLKIGNTVSDTDPTNLGYYYFKEILEEKSDGRIKVEVFSNQSVAETDKDVLEKVRDNTLQMGNTMPGLFAGLSGMEEYYIWNIPYIYKSNEDMYKIAESSYFGELNDDFLEKTGVRIIADASFNMGWYAFGANKDIPTIDDMKGLKLRINEIPQQISLAETIGFNPVFISFGEVYQSCQQGMVDGMMTAQNLFYSNRYYEVLDSIKILKNGAAFHQYIVNEEWYQSLPEDLRAIFDECVDEMTTYVREEEVEFTENAMKALADEGLTVYEVTEEESAELEKACVENIFPNKDVALVDYEAIEKVLKIVAE